MALSFFFLIIGLGRICFSQVPYLGTEVRGRQQESGPEVRAEVLCASCRCRGRGRCFVLRAGGANMWWWKKKFVGTE